MEKQLPFLARADIYLDSGGPTSIARFAEHTDLG
jgi:hypothetical protein